LSPFIPELTCAAVETPSPGFATGGPRFAATLNSDGEEDVLVFDHAGQSDVGLSFGALFLADPVGIASSDVNDDGLPDLVIVDPSGAVGVILGSSDGGYELSSVYQSGLFRGGSVSFAKLSRNGSSSIVVGGELFSVPSISILSALGGGEFVSGSVIPVAQDAGYSVVTVGDFNRDGLDDLAVSISFQNQIAILLSDGDGGFDTMPSLPIGTEEILPEPLVVGDFNGDGRLDIAVASSRQVLSLSFWGTAMDPFLPQGRRR
jgi:hypothetical protein